MGVLVNVGAEKHNVPYRSSKYFYTAMRSHFRLLYLNGQHSSINE